MGLRRKAKREGMHERGYFDEIAPRWMICGVPISLRLYGTGRSLRHGYSGEASR